MTISINHHTTLDAFDSLVYGKKMISIRHIAIVGALLCATGVSAETPEEWIALGTRIHGGFGSFIPLGIKIGLDATNRLHAKPRELLVVYQDSDASPCACFADGIAIATYASVGQRTLTISPEKAPVGDAAVMVCRPRLGGSRFQIYDPDVRTRQAGTDE